MSKTHLFFIVIIVLYTIPVLAQNNIGTNVSFVVEYQQPSPETETYAQLVVQSKIFDVFFRKKWYDHKLNIRSLIWI